MKFEAESQEFANFLRSLEQFIRTLKVQNNFRNIKLFTGGIKSNTLECLNLRCKNLLLGEGADINKRSFREDVFILLETKVAGAQETPPSGLRWPCITVSKVVADHDSVLTQSRYI